MNLDDYNARILKPMTLKFIRDGKFDSICADIYFDGMLDFFDEDTQNAIIDRLVQLWLLEGSLTK